MLVDVPMREDNPILRAMARTDGPLVQRLERGVYEACVGNFDHCAAVNLNGYDWGMDTTTKPWTFSYPVGLDGPYGVCDTPEQFLERYRAVLDADPRPFVVEFMIVKKEAVGGWRWHKWGPYIGEKDPHCEYLRDEGPEITQACCYHVYLVVEETVPGMECKGCGQALHSLLEQREGLHQGCREA